MSQKIVHSIGLLSLLYLFQACAYKPYQPISFSPLMQQSTILQLDDTTYKIVLNEEDQLIAPTGLSISKENTFKSKKHPLLQIQKQNDTLYLSNTGIKIKEVSNFRDLGGLRTKSGKQIVWGKFYRSGQLSKLKTSKFTQFEDLNIKTVVDLRTDKEIAKKPDHLPTSIQYNIRQAYDDSEDMFSKTKKEVLKGRVTRSQSDSLVSLFYAGYLIEKPEVVKNIIDTALNNDGSILFHCSAGKDRTGMIAALLLTILDVDRNVIIDDYILSNDYRKAPISSLMKLAKVGKLVYPKINYEVIENFQWIKQIYIEAMFKGIEDQYGSMDNYITNELKITPEQRIALQKQYTY